MAISVSTQLLLAELINYSDTKFCNVAGNMKQMLSTMVYV